MPAVHRKVALLAVGGVSLGLVIGIACFPKCGHVAADAFGGKSEAVELADGPNLVAGVAIHSRVSPDEREAILVLVDVVNGNLPAISVVAELALSAVLAAMQIGVAVLALYWGVAENKILVAIGALHFRVAAAQRKFGLRMIELELRSQRIPALRVVTLLALDLQPFAMRAMHRSIARHLLRKRNGLNG